MSIENLENIALALVASGKGIMAIDESERTIARRFDEVGMDNSQDNRRDYRELLLTTPNLSEHISGVILYDETIRQTGTDGVPFTGMMEQVGIIVGIKVDKGPVPMAGLSGDLITEGLDGLRPRLEEYARLGAQFAKWRAVINITEDNPSATAIDANCQAMARYAALCQEAGLVPMVEPEVMMDGYHSIDVSYEIHESVLRSLFNMLYEHNVLIEGTLLKSSMVIPGKDCQDQASVEEVAEATVRVLKACVPALLPGVVFLSGGQSDMQSTAHLNAMNCMGPHPWPLSFSYGRAMHRTALKLWASDQTANYVEAQKTVYDRARDNGQASLGQWKAL